MTAIRLERNIWKTAGDRDSESVPRSTKIGNGMGYQTVTWHHTERSNSWPQYA